MIYNPQEFYNLCLKLAEAGKLQDLLNKDKFTLSFVNNIQPITFQAQKACFTGQGGWNLILQPKKIIKVAGHRYNRLEIHKEIQKVSGFQAQIKFHFLLNFYNVLSKIDYPCMFDIQSIQVGPKFLGVF